MNRVKIFIALFAITGTLAEATPEMEVYRNSTLINPDDTNHFATVAPHQLAVRTFVVTNLQSAASTLILDGSPAVVFSENGQTNYNGFVITQNITGGSTNIAPGASSSFTISFTRGPFDTYSATVSIANNDPGSDPYTFRIEASVMNVWTPEYSENLVAWYDASDGESVQTSGTSVTNWNDKGPNGYDLITGTASFDGLPHISGMTAVRFAGTQQIYRDSIPDISLTDGVCLISAGQGGPGGDWHNWGRVKSTDGSSFLHYRRDGGSPRMTATVRINNTGNAFNFGNNPSSYADFIPFMCAVYYDPIGMAYLRGNGGADNGSGSRDAAATFVINNIHAGRDSNTMGHYHGEMIVAGTSDLAEIQILEGYLAWKWDLTRFLPGAHPYKDRPPLGPPPPGTLIILR